jgi:hypothetical protein
MSPDIDEPRFGHAPQARQVLERDRLVFAKALDRRLEIGAAGD